VVTFTQFVDVGVEYGSLMSATASLPTTRRIGRQKAAGQRVVRVRR
jgi:hypothetical protein